MKKFIGLLLLLAVVFVVGGAGASPPVDDGVQVTSAELTVQDADLQVMSTEYGVTSYEYVAQVAELRVAGDGFRVLNSDYSREPIFESARVRLQGDVDVGLQGYSNEGFVNYDFFSQPKVMPICMKWIEPG